MSDQPEKWGGEKKNMLPYFFFRSEKKFDVLVFSLQIQICWRESSQKKYSTVFAITWWYDSWKIPFIQISTQTKTYTMADLQLPTASYLF